MQRYQSGLRFQRKKQTSNLPGILCLIAVIGFVYLVNWKTEKKEK